MSIIIITLATIVLLKNTPLIDKKKILKSCHVRSYMNIRDPSGVFLVADLEEGPIILGEKEEITEDHRRIKR